MVTETNTKRTAAELPPELERLSAERLEVLREAGIEPFLDQGTFAQGATSSTPGHLRVEETTS